MNETRDRPAFGGLAAALTWLLAGGLALLAAGLLFELTPGLHEMPPGPGAAAGARSLGETIVVAGFALIFLASPACIAFPLWHAARERDRPLLAVAFAAAVLLLLCVVSAAF